MLLTVRNLWQSPSVRNWRHRLSPQRFYRSLTAEQRRLPDFIIVGAQKAGTTSLYHYLAEHPDMVPPIEKKLAFFDKNYHRGLTWYRAHFPRVPLGSQQCSDQVCGQRSFTGESTAYYLFHPLVPQRIADTLPNTKLIVLLRNPVDRTFSHYQYKVRHGKERLPFEAALDAEEERLAGEEDKLRTRPNYRSTAHFVFSYKARSIYVDQLKRWSALFPPEQILVLESGAMFKQPNDVYQRTLQFLGVRSWQPPEFRNHFNGGYKVKMDPATRRKLIEFFAPHNERLYTHLGQRFDWDR